MRRRKLTLPPETASLDDRFQSVRRPARALETRAPASLPTGFNLDPGKDQQREMQIRVVGTGQVASAAVAGDALTVIMWIPPQPDRAGCP
jgi:hypothetical protein